MCGQPEGEIFFAVILVAAREQLHHLQHRPVSSRVYISPEVGYHAQ
jgi:hypothetical protein